MQVRSILHVDLSKLESRIPVRESKSQPCSRSLCSFLWNWNKCCHVCLPSDDLCQIPGARSQFLILSWVDCQQPPTYFCWVIFLLLYLRNYCSDLASVDQLVGASSYKPKGCRFEPQSGHISGLWIRSLIRMHTGSKKPINVSHIDVSLFLSL